MKRELLTSLIVYREYTDTEENKLSTPGGKKNHYSNMDICGLTIVRSILPYQRNLKLKRLMI